MFAGAKELFPKLVPCNPVAELHGEVPMACLPKFDACPSLVVPMMRFLLESTFEPSQCSYVCASHFEANQD